MLNGLVLLSRIDRRSLSARVEIDAKGRWKYAIPKNEKLASGANELILVTTEAMPEGASELPLSCEIVVYCNQDLNREIVSRVTLKEGRPVEGAKRASWHGTRHELARLTLPHIMVIEGHSYDVEITVPDDRMARIINGSMLMVRPHYDRAIDGLSPVLWSSVIVSGLVVVVVIASLARRVLPRPFDEEMGMARSRSSSRNQH